MAYRILYVQYTNPAVYPPLQHGACILADAGWQVLFLGTGAYGADGLRFPEHPRIRVRQLPFCPAGWRQKLHYAAFALWVVAWTLRWRPLFLYVSDPLPCPVALLPSLFVRGRVVYHEHDSPGPGSAHSVFIRACHAARRVLARRARLCVLPNGRRVERFAREIGPGSRVVCAWNTPAREEVGPARPPHDGGDVWLLYHGSIVPSRLPLTVLAAMARLPDRLKLRVVGYETVGHRGHVQTFVAEAARLGLAARVEVVGTVPFRSELLAIARQADIGLALLPLSSRDPNEQDMAGASNKPFDYLACGLPLVVPASRDWEELYVRPGYALACDPADSASIACAIGWYLEHPDRMREMGEIGRRRIADDWNYERTFQPVMDSIGRDA